MKGLLYKELCLGKKNFLVFLILSLMFFVLGILVMFSMKIGNLKHLPIEDPSSVTLLVTVFSYLPAILFMFSASTCQQSICGDYSSGWMRYSYTLPVNPYKYIGVRYVLAGVIMFLGLVYFLLSSGVMCVLAERKWKYAMFETFALILLVFITIFLISLPLALKVKKMQTLTNIGVVTCVLMYFAFGVVFFFMTEKYGDDINEIFLDMGKIIKEWMLKSFLLVPLAVVFSYITSVKMYKRR